jgi:hypothetical protein
MGFGRAIALVVAVFVIVGCRKMPVEGPPDMTAEPPDLYGVTPPDLTAGPPDLSVFSPPDLIAVPDLTAPAAVGELQVYASGAGIGVDGAFATFLTPGTTTSMMQMPQGACQITTYVTGSNPTLRYDSAGTLTASGPGGMFTINPDVAQQYAGNTTTAILADNQVLNLSWAGATVPAGSVMITRRANVTLGCDLMANMNVPRNADLTCPFSGGSGGDLFFQITQTSGNDTRQAVCKFSGAGSSALIPTAALTGFNAGTAQLVVQLQSSQTANAGSYQVTAAWIGRVLRMGTTVNQPPININLQ